MKSDADFDWLLGHLPKESTLPSREKLALKVAAVVRSRIETGDLPFTCGVFGGWGSGKTTFLALLATELRKDSNRVIYFNSWKYAGFMEIVPSLIYKILKFGVSPTDQNRNNAATRVLLSLGKEYSDKFGEWAEERIGINPVELFKDVHKLRSTVKEEGALVRAELLKAYYGQVDKAQDALAEALGEVELGKEASNPVIVLIDELDRCDPDEAFNVIKQMRVLFAMRRVPVAFVVCANPEPIGLAIKHRYGLESMTSDYEARRILEKFVDAYEDLSEVAPLGPFVMSIWEQITSGHYTPWIVNVDAENGDVGLARDTMRNAAALDSMNTSVHQYSNLRVIQKALVHVEARSEWNRHLLWTTWHLEIVSQIDPEFRQTIRTLASPIADAAMACYQEIGSIRFKITKRQKGPCLEYISDKGGTLFAIYRSLFWEKLREQLKQYSQDDHPQGRKKKDLLDRILSNPSTMDFLILMSLVPFHDAKSHGELVESQEGSLPDLMPELRKGLRQQLGWLLANY